MTASGAERRPPEAQSSSGARPGGAISSVVMQVTSAPWPAISMPLRASESASAAACARGVSGA